MFAAELISVLSWKLNGLPFSESQGRFRRSYRTEAPIRTTMRGLVNKFQGTGNVCDEKHSAWSSTSQETVETIWQAIEQSPKASTHRLSALCDKPCASYWWKRPITSKCWSSPNSTFTVHFFAETTITSTSYLDMLEQFLQHQLFADNILDLIMFLQDGALPHFVHIVRNYLNETFPGRCIGRGSPRFWTARSRNLTPLEFFSWGHIMTQVNTVKIRDL